MFDLINVAVTLNKLTFMLYKQVLRQLGADNLDAEDEDHETAVMVASYNGDIRSVKALHLIKADLNARTKAGTAIHRAVEAGYQDVLKVTCR